MRKILVLLLTLGVLLGACESGDMEMPADAGTSGTVFKLGRDPFENMSTTRSANEEKARYDRLEYYILDESGKPVEGVKSLYRAESSEIVVEGLHEGDYSLLVLGIVGDYERDGVVINTLSDISDVWLTFPENMNTSLCAEYYYSRTPFSVIRHQTADGMIEMVSVDTEIHQKRIMGRMDYSLGYSNDYVRTAMVSRKVNLVSPKFYTQFTADSVFSGQTSGQDMTFDLDESESLFFMPSLSSFEGTVDLISRDYKGGRTEQVYHFDGAELEPNKINDVKVAVRHPDDDSGLMFVTDKAYLEGKHGKILQDGEPVSVYTDARQRSFSTMNLLQTSITDEGQLHLRFYSPRSIEGVTVKARIPAISDEYVDFAYFDTIPDFADIFLEVPAISKALTFTTESGRFVLASKLSLDDLKTAEFKIVSECPYWKQLQSIRTNWTARFELFGGDPNRADGGPNGNWMGIRPVHCREVVALFINFTFMIDMPEHEQILMENGDRLYGNGGENDKVTPERVLEQMRQSRSLAVGLVYPGNGVIGLGSPSIWGVYQDAFKNHYSNYYVCSVIFHELGHVMNYSHNSSFAYGFWDQELMNHFYVDNLDKFPINSREYTRITENPNLY